MQSKYLIIVASILCCSASAQDGLKVDYLVRFNDDFDRGRNERLHNASLLIKDGISKYFMVGQQDYKQLNENDFVFSPDTGMVIYTDQARGYLIAKEYNLNGNAFFLSDSLYPMHWEITAEEKKLDSFNCIKAKCVFRGREYIAWFTPDIPVPYGPWKMGGLPGLIIDLQDSDENIVVKLKSISSSFGPIELPVAIRYTMAEHIKETRKMIRQLQAGARASTSGDCLTCTGHSTYNFYFWEKIPQ